MLKKIVLFVLGFLAGCIVGGILVMAYCGYTLSRGMFMLQDADILRAEDTATQAYLDESPQIGIWALENYLDFFDAVIEQRTAAIDKMKDEAQSVFPVADPKSRWIGYVRLGLLYEKSGNVPKKDESFQKAAEIFGRKVEEGNSAVRLSGD